MSATTDIDAPFPFAEGSPPADLSRVHWQPAERVLRQEYVECPWCDAFEECQELDEWVDIRGESPQEIGPLRCEACGGTFEVVAHVRIETRWDVTAKTAPGEVPAEPAHVPGQLFWSAAGGTV